MAIDREGQLRRIDYGDRIYFDSVTGIAGVIYPIGTAAMPSDVIADVITILAARNLKKIDVHGTLTLGAAMTHRDFFGNYHESGDDIINLGGQDVSDSHFKGLIITGVQGGAGFATYKECLFLSTLPIPMLGFRGLAENCAIFSGLTLATGNSDYADFDHCTSVHGHAMIVIGSPNRVSFKEFSCGLILSAQAAGEAFVIGISGYLEVDEMTGGTLDIYAHGAEIQINGDCRAPAVITIYGDARVTILAGNTATVNDHTKETQLDDIEATADPLVMGRAQVFEKSITNPANTGDVVVATITDQPCQIESVIIHADTVQPGHMTNCGVFGGAAKVITFIAAADALQADLDAIDKQVYWEGKVRLAATKTIVISLVGTGTDNVDLTIVIKYRACVSGGYLV